LSSQVVDFNQAIDKVVRGQGLSLQESEDAMGLIMSGKVSEAQIASFLTALRMKGETVEEITGCARVMRDKVTSIKTDHTRLVDTCGTGGDQSSTFNISTTAAFVAAGVGLPVAKHGNRSVSSRCGSADVLEALGVNLDISPLDAAASIEKIGIGFLFAPKLHLAMKHAIKPRKEIGIRTIFNILGPLTNPAKARRQVIGVYAPELTEVLAYVLLNLGTEHALIVHGLDGIDEITICEETKISELKNGQVKTYYLKPEDLGFERARSSEIKGGEIEQNARITSSILEGKKGPGRNIVVINAAAVLVAGRLAENFSQGVKLAEESIDKGEALGKLELLREFNRSCLCS